MGDPRPEPYRLFPAETTRTVLLFALASALGLAGVLLFVYSPSDEPTQLHLGLLVCSAVVVFYLTIRSSPV